MTKIRVAERLWEEMTDEDAQGESFLWLGSFCRSSAGLSRAVTEEQHGRFFMIPPIFDDQPGSAEAPISGW